MREVEIIRNTDARECVSVVIVTYNSATTIETALQKVEDEAEIIREVIVHDNNSSDDTCSIVRDFASRSQVRIVLIEGENIGFGRGVSEGLAAAPGWELALVLNPDVYLTEGVLPQMVMLADKVNDAGIVTAPLNLLNGSADPASVRRFPKTGSSSAYALLGRLLPVRWRYNGPVNGVYCETTEGVRFKRIDATTGALMLIPRSTADLLGGVFDHDYWMYGEDLQLCLDVHRASLAVLMLDGPASIHVKGVSSGLPRSRRADRAFHEAMWLYYKKNLSRNSSAIDALVHGGVALRYVVSRSISIMLDARQGHKAERENRDE